MKSEIKPAGVDLAGFFCQNVFVNAFMKLLIAKIRTLSYTLVNGFDQKRCKRERIGNIRRKGK